MCCKRLCRATSKSSLKSLKGYILVLTPVYASLIKDERNTVPDLDSYLATLSQSFSNHDFLSQRIKEFANFFTIVYT